MAKTVKKPREAKRSPKKWTVMVYMAAENSSELDAVAVEDLREMEKGVNGNAHVAVQINRAWPAVPQRYEILSKRGKRGQSELVDVDRNGTNMGTKGTLARFLKWAVSEFPADHYCLVLWGHAYGLGFGRDHDDALTLKELKDALQVFRHERQKELRKSKSGGDPSLDLLGANACAMSYVEAAYELRRHAQYMVASQIAVPFAGWPYELILGRINSTTSAEDLGELVVNAYVSHFNGLIAGERVTMTLLRLGALSEKLREVPDLRGVRDFKDLIQKLALALRKESQFGGRVGDGRGHVRDVFIAAASGDVRPLIDLKDLCEDFSDTESKNLRSLAKRVQTFLEVPPPPRGPRDGFVLQHNGHPELLKELHGVGIFAPFVTDDQDLKRLELQDDQRNGHVPRGCGRQAYQNLALFGGNRAAWPRLVYDELRQSAPSELLTCLVGLGASSREDRRDITQIALAIESSFNKLDRVLTEGTKLIDKQLKKNIDAQANSALGQTSQVGKTRTANREDEKRFGPPWLKLIQAPDIEAQVATLKQLLTLKAFERVARSGAGTTKDAVRVGTVTEPDIGLFAYHPELLDPIRSMDPELVSTVVDFFIRVEKAVGEVERATRKGLTNARLGLGPSAPDRFTFAEEPKSGHGFAEEPKSGHGLAEEPKSGHGFTEEPKSGHGSNGFQGRDLRVDLAFARVVDLFGQVGQALRQLEDATLELENTARAAFSNGHGQPLTAEMLAAAAVGIRRALEIVEESSKNARRTIRSAFSHPVYGLGPGSGAIGLEGRESLANAGGLSRRTLRLL